MIFLEDFEPGRQFSSGFATLTDADIKAFAARFDPQPFHLDEDAARSSVFKGLAASGWHTAALTMRLLVESDIKPAGGIVGVSVENLRWLAPVRPGDVLTVQSEVLERAPSSPGSNHGLLKLKSSTLNQRAEIVQTMVANLLVRRRS